MVAEKLYFASIGTALVYCVSGASSKVKVKIPSLLFSTSVKLFSHTVTGPLPLSFT